MSKKRNQNNYAFIDVQNLNLGIRSLGWALDFKKFRIYLKDKYGVRKAFLFLGFISKNQNMYQSLKKSGYILKFKPTLFDKDGKIKGNIDADMVLQVMVEVENYDKAVIITSDGDFYSLVEYLYSKNKLEIVLSSHIKTCSALLKRTAKEKIQFIDQLQVKLQYKK